MYREIGDSEYGPQSMYQPLTGNKTSTEADVITDCHLQNQSAISKNLWYHGSIPRSKAETMVRENGDFLIRDSISKKGDFVLTCWWNGSPLHFMVNRQVVRDSCNSILKVQYQFEQELCDTVPELISMYIREHKPVSDASGAIISKPVNRRLSADSYLSNQNTKILYPVRFSSKSIQKSGSQPFLSLSDSKNALDNLHKTQSDSSDSSADRTDPQSEEKSHLVVGGHFTLNNSKSAPPKPSRMPTIKLQNTQRPRVTVKNKLLYEEEKDDSDYIAVKSWPKDMHRTPQSVVLLTDFYNSSTGITSKSTGPGVGKTVSVLRDHIYDIAAITLPDMTPASKFECHDYNSNILTENNKPLEKLAQSLILQMLGEADVKTLAMHLTLLDLDLLKVTGSHYLGAGVKSGLELITLPQGYQLRKDALERFENLCSVLLILNTSITL